MELDKWWSGLRVTEKERIARKILDKNPEITGCADYPHCTELWNRLEVGKKEWIYNHCKFRHGYLDKIEFEGNPFTD